MANYFFVIITIYLGICCVNSDTIKDIIHERDELVKLKQYMKDLPFYRTELASNGEKKYTFFAPQNSAFDNVPAQVKARYFSSQISSTARDELNDIFQYHTAFHYDYMTDVYDTYTTDQMGNLKVSSSADGSPSLFFRTIGDEHFVNGAMILVEDIKADNGILHIIDTVLYEEPITTNALEFIQNRQSGSDTSMKFSKFYDLLEKYQEEVGVDGNTNAYDIINRPAPMTLFLPSDDAMNRLSSNKLAELKEDLLQLRTVIESHVIRNRAYHTEVLLHMGSVSAMVGEVEVGTYLNQAYVSNNCAKGTITKANITVNNGPVHVINGILGYVYSDIFDVLKDGSELNDFRLLVQAVTSVLELVDIQDSDEVANEDLYTMFAPIDDGMVGSNFHGNARREEQIVQMHMLRGRHELSSMTEDTPHVQTLRPGSDFMARFYQEDNGGVMETYVQVDYVRSKIIEGDICVRNGIVHRVDHIVGLPSMTILDFLESSDDLRSLYEAIRTTGLDTVLADEQKRQTFLAPSNEAFDLMSEDAEGSRLLSRSNRAYLKNVMNRHLLPGEAYIFDKIQGSSMSVESNFNKEVISMSKSGKDYFVNFGGSRVPVKLADYRMKNGMVHVIEAVLFSSDPGASEWISSANHVTWSHVLYTSCVLLTNVLFKIW